MESTFELLRQIEKENDIKKIPAEKYDELAEEKMTKANALVTADGRMLDEYAVRYYYSWTDLEGLVGELTMNVPKIERIEAQDLEEFDLLEKHIINNLVDYA